MTTTTISRRVLRSACPLARTLEVVGDRWTLLIVRDLLSGKSRFNEFLSSPEGVTTNILANRLKRMEKEGLLSKSLYQERPNRYAYALTEKGRTLVPVLHALCRWGNRWDPDSMMPPDWFMELDD
jgi:DNA-binding HxlR family transcriptional regulator